MVRLLRDFTEHKRLWQFWAVALFALTVPWYGDDQAAALYGKVRAYVEGLYYGSSPIPTASQGAIPADLPGTPASFSQAKRILYEQVHGDRRVTFYCGCSYNAERRVDLASCGVVPRKNAKRAARVEAEHVFPAWQFGNHRRCWREPQAVCGGDVSGRRCCEKTDPVFIAAHNDLHNLMPAVGEVNGDRSNYNWGMIPGEAREYGRCNMEVDSSIRRAEPPEHVMGDIARVMFYMAETYGLRLSRQDRQLYGAWNRQDPPDDWERERNRRIAAIQGRGNPYVERYQQLLAGGE